MKHAVRFRKFSRNTTQRKALFRALITSLFEHGRIETTLAKCKEIRSIAEKIITVAKVKNVQTIREVMKFVYTDHACKKLFDERMPKIASRPGGYLRILKLGNRISDAAPVGVIEFVD